LGAFGLRALPRTTSLGELVLAKPLKFSTEEYDKTAALDFNIRYGPPYFKVHETQISMPHTPAENRQTCLRKIAAESIVLEGSYREIPKQRELLRPRVRR
jgi:hypothetical protein